MKILHRQRQTRLVSPFACSFSVWDEQIMFVCISITLFVKLWKVGFGSYKLSKVFKWHSSLHFSLFTFFYCKEGNCREEETERKAISSHLLFLLMWLLTCFLWERRECWRMNEATFSWLLYYDLVCGIVTLKTKLYIFSLNTSFICFQFCFVSHCLLFEIILWK